MSISSASLQNWDQEAAEDEPVIVNPFRHSIPAEFRNGDKLASGLYLCYPTAHLAGIDISTCSHVVLI